MIFNSVEYLVFFPLAAFIYFLIPKKNKYIWLLVCSYYFYMCWNVKYVLLLLTSTLITYFCALFLNAVDRTKLEGKKTGNRKKIIISISLILNLGVLFFFKYTGFALMNVSRILSSLNINIQIPEFDIILPVGISFFTFQALGYIIDVYRGDIKAEKNILRYALFISFFPQLVAGPIERSKNLLMQLHTSTKFDLDKVRSGLLTMAYGLILKIVIADNIALVVDPVFKEPELYAGMELMIATILFAFQVYCDFEGYSKLAIGSAEVLGYKLNDNFKSPYFATSVREFWRRWHISLTSWFKDYLYIPLGGSRKGRIRKHINTMIIFLCSGLWHGAAWHYVAWGGLNGGLCIAEDIIAPKWNWLKGRLKINESAWMYKLWCRFATLVFIDITMLFFRAGSLGQGLFIFKMILADFRPQWLLGAGYVSMFGEPFRLLVIIFSLGLLAAVDYFRYRGNDIKKLILGQQIVFRWTIYVLMMLIILYWGIYGRDYAQTQFIYFQF